MKRISLILFSLLLITVCAISFAEEAPWVTKETVREHSGYVWREEIPRYNGAEERGFQPLVQLISFSGWGWGEEGTLIFVEQWPNWYLWDYIPFSCEDFRLCGTDDGTGVYLEFGVIGHGTGCYVQYKDVYHLQTRKIEASYTTYGYEVFQNAGIQVYGSACYARDGVHIFRQLSPLAFDEAQNEFVPTGAVLDVFDYSIGEQGHLERRVNDDE